MVDYCLGSVLSALLTPSTADFEGAGW